MSFLFTTGHVKMLKEREFSSFRIGEFFICNNDLYLTTDRAEALNLSRVRQDSSYAYEDFEDETICEDATLALKIG